MRQSASIEPGWCAAAPGGVMIDVRVIPRAGRTGIAGTRGGALLVRLNSPPVEGAANAELIGVLAEALGVARSAIAIVRGERSRAKQVRVAGLDALAVESRIAIRRRD